MKHLNCEWRRLVVAAVLAMVGSLLVITTSSAQSSEGCRAYAEDYSYRYSAGIAQFERGTAADAERRPDAAGS